MKSFKQFSEEKKKEVVFTFGRFNPPTIGHGKLLAKVAAAAIGNDYRIYASQSSDPKKNPLEYKEKIKVMRKMFPNHGRNIVEDKNAKTALHIASILHDQGFTKIAMVVGSDRIKEFQKLLTTYNGVKGRHGYYDFKDGIDVISAGERDPDAEGVSGMSASKMRQAASEGDFKSFMMGIPKAYGEHKTLFNLVRKRMGLKEKNNFREHIELPSLSETRERYIAGEIFNVGDTVYVGEVPVVIKERKSNFVICEEGEKYFINVLSEKLNKTYGKGLSKSTKDKRQAQFNKQAKLDDDDPKAYKPAPGDARAKTKLSKHTIAYRKKFGKDEALEFGTDELASKYKKDTPGQISEKSIKGLEKKAEESGISYGILKKVFDRGMAAWKTGHRPGATPHQWAFARVNSFITGGKTRTTADKDLWAKHKGKKESVEESTLNYARTLKAIEKDRKMKNISDKDKETLGKIADLMKKLKEEESCPTAAGDVELNTKNRDATIKKFMYGPLNVNEPGDYWEKVAKKWDTTVTAAKKSLCANCVAFDISPRMKDCMPGKTSDGEGELGYCWMHHFKCHSARTCTTWAKGGPIEDDETSYEWGAKSGLKEGSGKSETWEQGYERRVVKTTDPNHLEKGFNWRIKGKERAEISIKLYKQKPDFAEYKKQMKRVAGHEFGK